VTYSLKSCKSLITFDFTVGFNPDNIALLLAVRNYLGRFILPNSFRDRTSSSILAISSILNRKTTRQHSPLSGTLLDAKHFTLYFDWEAPDFIRDSL
jgi:hypothetical protein